MEEKDWKKFEKNNKTIALKFLFSPNCKKSVSVVKWNNIKQ